MKGSYPGLRIHSISEILNPCQADIAKTPRSPPLPCMPKLLVGLCSFIRPNVLSGGASYLLFFEALTVSSSF